MRLGVYAVSLEKKPFSRERSARRLLEYVRSRGYHLAKVNGFISKVWLPTKPNASQVTLLVRNGRPQNAITQMEIGSFVAVFYGVSSEENTQELQYGISLPVYICRSTPMAEGGHSKRSKYWFESNVRHHLFV